MYVCPHLNHQNLHEELHSHDCEEVAVLHDSDKHVALTVNLPRVDLSRVQVCISAHLP
jgi:hypothetical protein